MSRTPLAHGFRQIDTLITENKAPNTFCSATCARAAQCAACDCGARRSEAGMHAGPMALQPARHVAQRRGQLQVYMCGCVSVCLFFECAFICLWVWVIEGYQSEKANQNECCLYYTPRSRLPCSPRPVQGAVCPLRLGCRDPVSESVSLALQVCSVHERKE